MPRIAAVGALLLSLWTAGRPAAAQGPGFTLELVSASPESFRGLAGSPFGPFEVSAALRPSELTGPEGPRGWSIAVSHEPGASLLELLQVTSDGTNAGELLDRQGGFLHLSIIDPAKNGGKEGYVSTAVLSLERPVHLPPDRLSTIATATYRGVHPPVTEWTVTPLAFRFTDGLAGGEGPVVNRVTYLDQVYSPALRPLLRKLSTTSPCNAGLTLDLSAPGAVLSGGARSLQVELPAGQDLVFEATASLSVSLAGTGPEAWSISVKHDRPFFQILSATADDTDVMRRAEEDPKLRFMKVEMVEGDAGSGFIAAGVLSLNEARTLPSSGDFSIARARYRLVAPHDEPGAIGATPIRCEDGLQGNSPWPVDNIITVEGKTERPCRKVPLRVEVQVVRGGTVFLRGEANNDGRVNLSDPIWVAGMLFFTGATSPCPRASDANGDLRIDAADIVFLLSYLFQAGAPIPPPFPACAPSPRLDDPLACEESGVRCP